MPISPENKICYIHIPKTGGTTIESMLPGVFPNELIGIEPWDKQTNNLANLFGNNLQHLTYKEIIDLKPEVEKDNYFVFTTVRNPYERVVSMVGWRNKRWTKKMEITQSEFNKYIKELELRWIKNKLLLHEIPQYKFLDEDLKCVDYILKLDEINESKIEEMEKMMKIKNYNTNFKFNYDKNKILMKSFHKNYIEYFNKNKKAIELINKIYYMDFRIFNYPKLELIV